MSSVQVVRFRGGIRKWTVTGILALSVCRLLLIDDAAAVFAADPGLPEILQHLDEWRQSFASIRVVSHVWNRADVLESHPDLDPNSELEGKYYSRHEFLWADWGAMRSDEVSFREGTPFYRDSHGCDGIQPWEANGTPGDGGKLELIKLNVPRPGRPLFSRMTQVSINGLYDPPKAAWINTLLRGVAGVPSAADLEGFEDFDGHRCAVVVMKHVLDNGSEYEETYWLDPEYDYLPRKVVEKGPSSAEPGLTHYLTWTVDRFQKLAEGIWFPEHGNLVGGSNKPPGFEWVIKKVILNESLPRSEFGPPNIAGTPVIDYVRGTTYRIGHEERPPTNDASAAGSDSATGETASGSPVLAVPQEFPWHWVGLIGGVAVAGGIALRWLQRVQ